MTHSWDVESAEDALLRQQREESLAQVSSILEGVLSTLTPKWKDIFVGISTGTSTVEELGTRWGIDDSAVKNNFNRAKTALKQHTSLRQYLDLFDQL